MAIFANTPDKITYFAETDYRSKRIKFGIRDADRERHMYIIGKTGMGKSTLLENLAIQDIVNGEGLCFIDPHGGTAETLLSYVPEHRIKDVIYFAPHDQEYPVALNVMEDIGRDRRPLVASGLIGAFKKVWVDAWSARMEYILSNALLALLEYPGATLLGVNRLFADKNYRSLIVNNLTDPSVKAFWVDEYAKYSDKFATEATAAIQNKVGQFAANPLIRNMVGQSNSTFDIRKVMDERKILIVNLSKGRIGEGNANLIGSMLITKIYLAAMSRADVGPEVVRGLPPFYLYVDEFQSFANESFADILSEARKYKLSLTIAHQYIEQMSDEVRAAVFGNVGTMCTFRVGAYDAEVLEKEFAPAFTAEDMVNLGFAQIYLRLMINGVGSSPFSATTLNRPKFPSSMFTNEVIAASRAQFGRPRAVVEEEIRKWHEPVPEPPRDPNAPSIPETRKYPPGMRPVRSGPVGASAPYSGIPRNVHTAPSVSPGVGLSASPRDSAGLSAATEQHRDRNLPPVQNVQNFSQHVASSVPPTPSAVMPLAPRPLQQPVLEPLAPPPLSIEPKKSFVGLPADFGEHALPLGDSTPAVEKPSTGGVSIRTDRIVPGSTSSAPVRTIPSASANFSARQHGAGNERHAFPEKTDQKIHQPFREKFEALRGEPKNTTPLLTRKEFDQKRPPAQITPPVSPARGSRENSREKTHIAGASIAPLSLLKSQPKKDKGPSTQNLSSLKALIDAAFVGGTEGGVKERPELTKTPHVGSAEKMKEEKIPAQFPSAPPSSSLQTFPAAAPSLLGDTSSSALPKEVPEEVLRGVLAD